MKRLFYILSLAAVLLVSCGDELAAEISPTTYPPELAAGEVIAVFGDIQYLTDADKVNIFSHSCEWIRESRRSGVDINCVLQVGDVTSTNSQSQWAAFADAADDLAGEVPFFAAIGDHDYSWDSQGHINDRAATFFNDYVKFPKTTAKIVAAFEPGRMENVVVENYIYNVPVYLLILEFGPRREVVEWAIDYVQNHRDVNFILVNHEYLEAGGGLRTKKLKCVSRLGNSATTYTTPTQLWEQLVKPNDNILCVLCGHVGGLYAFTSTRNDAGREVPQIQHNIQSAEFRYDNWLMLLTFREDGTAIVSIINTKTNLYYNNQHELFRFKYRNADYGL